MIVLYGNVSDLDDFVENFDLDGYVEGSTMYEYDLAEYSITKTDRVAKLVASESLLKEYRLKDLS